MKHLNSGSVEIEILRVYVRFIPRDNCECALKVALYSRVSGRVTFFCFCARLTASYY